MKPKTLLEYLQNYRPHTTPTPPPTMFSSIKQFLLRKLFDKLIAPGIRSKRSTLLGLLTFGIPLALAYLHSGEQLLTALSKTLSLLVAGGDNPGTADLNSGMVQLAIIAAIVKAWLTHDPAQIEGAGIPRAEVVE